MYGLNFTLKKRSLIRKLNSIIILFLSSLQASLLEEALQNFGLLLERVFQEVNRLFFADAPQKLGK